MADTKPSGTQVNIGSILIKGASTGTGAARLERALRLGLGRVLGGLDLTGSVGHSIDISRLKLQLLPQATEAEIAEALAHAIARTSKGDRS